MNDFAACAKIGSGSTAEVYSCIHKKLQRFVAVKVMTDDADEEYFEQEAKNHESLDHPFLCQYYGRTMIRNRKAIVTELVQGVTLLELVNREHGLSLHRAAVIFAQIAVALEYMHNEKRMAHRDVKLENVMVDNFDRVKLLDFGFTSSTAEGMFETICGSAPYAAPEIFNGETYSYAIDVWSLGVCLYGMVMGSLPFQGGNVRALSESVMHGEIRFPDTVTPEFVDLVKQMLNRSPSERITMENVLKHPFITLSTRPDLKERIAQNPAVNMRITSVNDIDREIVEKLLLDGYKEEDIYESLLNPAHSDSEILLAYRILKSDKVKEIMSTTVMPNFRFAGRHTITMRSQNLPTLKPLTVKPDVRRSRMKVMSVGPPEEAVHSNSPLPENPLTKHPSNLGTRVFVNRKKYNTPPRLIAPSILASKPAFV